MQVGRVEWPLLGEHNQLNALAAIASAEHAGIAPADAARALHGFVNVKRRLELRGEAQGVKVYDDFAHHPTAIRTTIDGLRRRIGEGVDGAGPRILAVLERGSNTARMRGPAPTTPSPMRRRSPSMVVRIAVGWCAKSS